MAQDPIQLQGFNNLTKCLSFNLYDFVVARSSEERRSYERYIQERFNAAHITRITKEIASLIGSEVLSVSKQDYEPHGASSLLLMSDLGHKSVGAHLTKSHITTHTYPDFLDPRGICSFRVDIDIATCGTIVPLRALDFMFHSFASDVVIVDYVVRGFTRDREGNRVYMDHTVRSIQDFIDPKILEDYHCVDLVIGSEHIWQTKLLRTRLEASEYFFPGSDPHTPQNVAALADVQSEMRGIFEGLPR